MKSLITPSREREILAAKLDLDNARKSVDRLEPQYQQVRESELALGSRVMRMGITGAFNRAVAHLDECKQTLWNLIAPYASVSGEWRSELYMLESPEDSRHLVESVQASIRNRDINAVEDWGAAIEFPPEIEKLIY